MTSNHHALYVLGYTRATMVGTTRSEIEMLSETLKTNLSSDCRLQLAYMKSGCRLQSELRQIFRDLLHFTVSPLVVSAIVVRV